jgi:hypothetical protein
MAQAEIDGTGNEFQGHYGRAVKVGEVEDADGGGPWGQAGDRGVGDFQPLGLDPAGPARDCGCTGGAERRGEESAAAEEAGAWSQ